MARCVEIGSQPQDRDVGLRLAGVVERERVLHPHDGQLTETLAETRGEAGHERCMQAADGGHVDDLSGDQFDPVVRRENSGLTHPLKLRHGEPVSGGGNDVGGKRGHRAFSNRLREPAEVSDRKTETLASAAA
jgi:hypothetical protein